MEPDFEPHQARTSVEEAETLRWHIGNAYDLIGVDAHCARERLTWAPDIDGWLPGSTNDPLEA